MRPWCVLVLGLLLGAGAWPGPAAAAPRPGPVAVEVVTADGRPLGRLAGTREARVTYFLLEDVARLAGAALHRRGPREMRLRVRSRAVTLRRGQAAVLAGGRRVHLAAPVQVRHGTWLVPGDLVVRVLPGLLGTGLRVTAVAPAPRIVRAAPAGPGSRTSRPPPPVTAAGPAPEAPAPAPRPAAPPSREAPGLSAPVSAPTRAGPAAAPLELRHRSYPTYTRVVLEAPRALEPRLVEQDGGLLVGLAGWSGPVARTAREVRDGLIGELDLGEARGGPALRVVYERTPASRRVFRLTDPPRVVLDFYRPPAAPAAPGAAGPAPAPAVRTVVLDAGHGGHDPGAIGPGGLQEKTITLDLARRAAALLQEDLGVRAILTRTGDRFLPLRERTAIANREKGDLFVSIHLNAAPGATASGTESYFLSSEATDNAARAAAAFENRVIALEAGAGGPSRDTLRSILWDLAQSDFQQESSRLAEALQGSLDRALRLPSRGVKQAPFYVLGGAAMPAVLVETGFLTNPQEEQRLRDEGYRDRIARAVAAGVAAYKRDYEQRAATVKR